MTLSIYKITQVIFGLTVILAVQLTANAESAKAGKYKIDPAHSTVLFTANHLGISELTGRFNTFEGNLVINPRGGSSMNVSIQTASVDTNHRKRNEHLSSPDFLNVKQFPTMNFVAKDVRYNSSGEPVKIIGKLTLHGKTNPVTLNITPIGAGNDPWGGYRAGYNATTVIKRSAYGMNFMQGGISDDIRVTLNIEAIKQ